MFFTARSTLTSRIWDPRSPPSAKNYENVEKIKKIRFSKLDRESFLHIPCILWELSDTSRHVFHIGFAPKSHCQAPFPRKPRAEKWNISKICVKLVSKTHPLCSLRARRLSKHAFLPSSLKALPVPCRPGSSNWVYYGSLYLYYRFPWFLKEFFALLAFWSPGGGQPFAERGYEFELPYMVKI